MVYEITNLQDNKNASFNYYWQLGINLNKLTIEVDERVTVKIYKFHANFARNECENSCCVATCALRKLIFYKFNFFSFLTC